MACVKEFMIGAAKVRIFDDDLEPDQAAAWAHAREVQARINREIARKERLERMAQDTKAST